MEVQLPPALEAFVRERVASGRYRDESEVMSEALRRWEDDDAVWEEALAAIDEGDADLAAGRVHDFENTADMRAYLATL